MVVWAGAFLGLGGGQADARAPSSTPGPAIVSHGPAPAGADPFLVTYDGNDYGDISANWSGYAVTPPPGPLPGPPGPYTSVTGSWTVPTVAPSQSVTASDAWVGIDGMEGINTALIQAGTEQRSSGGGTQYFVWWTTNELGFNEQKFATLSCVSSPCSGTPSSLTVSPGDHMQGAINETGPNTWAISLTDTTTGVEGTQTGISHSGPGASAEWIFEAPSALSNLSNIRTLADYGSTTFDNATVNGSAPGFVATASGSNALLMVSNDRTRASIPSAPDTGDASPDGFAVAYGTPGTRLDRLYGQDAIGTAIAISQREFPTPGSAPAVVLARSDFFADALAGGPLAAQVSGPLLITPGAPESSPLDPRVLAEIQRVLSPGGTVYVLGGDLALSPGIDSTLQALGYQVVRIAGADEFDTAVKIASQLGNPSTIFEATGLDFADALSAVPAAIAAHGAILLADGPTQAPETAAYLAAHPGDTRYAIGGPLAAYGADPGAIPVYGQDLYETSAAVATTFFLGAGDLGVATGASFSDALAGGVFMASDGPVLLVAPSGPLPAATAAYMASRTQQPGGYVLIFGGPLAVPQSVASAIQSTFAFTGSSPPAPPSS